jgi:shikimate kinase
MLVFLIGYMGSGKSTIGKTLARSMNYPFHDMDQIFEKHAGMNIPDFFKQFGEVAFRKRERELLTTICQWKDAVISTGGGTPCYYDNLEMMNRAGVTVYLNLNVEELYERLNKDEHIRPLLMDAPRGNLKDYISRHLREREKYYLKAKVVHDPLQSDIDELINRIK